MLRKLTPHSLYCVRLLQSNLNKKSSNLQASPIHLSIALVCCQKSMIICTTGNVPSHTGRVFVSGACKHTSTHKDMASRQRLPLRNKLEPQPRNPSCSHMSGLETYYLD